MATSPLKNLRHFVYARENVNLSLRGYSIIINGHEVSQSIRKDLFQAFSTDTPDSRQMAAFRKINPEPGENPFGEFFLFKKIPNHAEWVFGKGTVEHRGNETVGFYDSYVFHGVLLNRAELLRLNCNPFYLSPLLSPFIGDNRSYKEPIPFPEIRPDISSARLDALKALPLFNRLAFLNLASRLLKEAVFSDREPPRAIPASIPTDSAFWSLFHLLLPFGTIFEKDLPVTSFRSFVNPHWRSDFFYGADIPPGEDYIETGHEAGPFAALMFREINRDDASVARPEDGTGGAGLLDMVPAALEALKNFEKDGADKRFETSADAFDATIAAATKQGVSSIGEWPEKVAGLYPYRISHLLAVWRRNRPDFGLPGDRLSSAWAFRFLYSLDSMADLETAHNLAREAPELSRLLPEVFPYLSRSEQAPGFFEKCLKAMASAVNERVKGRPLLIRIANDPAWLLSPNLGELYSMLDDKRKALLLRRFTRNFNYPDERFLKFATAGNERAQGLFLAASAVLGTARRNNDCILDKKVLKLFTTCANIGINRDAETLMKETMAMFPWLFSGYGPEWEGLARGLGLAAYEKEAYGLAEHSQESRTGRIGHSPL